MPVIQAADDDPRVEHPRDALASRVGDRFEGPVARAGLSLRLDRTGLEVAVVVIGLLLGGVVGVGTFGYALAIGPLTQLMLPWFTVDLPAREAQPVGPGQRAA